MNIIELAEQAGVPGLSHPEWRKSIEKFAALVEAAARADEREACAKVCDDLIAPDFYRDTDVSMWDVTCIDCAATIRARGTT
jgi:hypothetical protein